MAYKKKRFPIFTLLDLVSNTHFIKSMQQYKNLG